jgi:hypothetical protein
VAGIVLDAHGKPISGASVYCVCDIRRRLPATTSDSAGRYKLEGIPPGDVVIHAYKESDWYPDDFFAFFKGLYPLGIVSVKEGKTTGNVTIRLGPKAGRINFIITDEEGRHLGASLSITREDMPQDGAYGTGVKSPHSMLVPPVPLRVTIEPPAVAPGGIREDFETWHSGVITPRSEETLEITVRLKRL